MNEELWKRLPTPCERIGQRARACVRVCLAFGAVWSWARLLDCPGRGPGVQLPARSPYAGGAAGVDTEGWGLIVGCWRLDAPASRREVREGCSKAEAETYYLRPHLPVPPGPSPYSRWVS